MKTGDRGFTMIELLVTIALSGIVGAMATTVIISSFHQQSALDARTTAVAHVRTALQRTMRELREATLQALGPDSLQMQVGTTGPTLKYDLETTNGVTSLVVNDGSNKSVVVTNLVNDPTKPAEDVFTVNAPVLNYSDPTGTVNTSTCVITTQPPTAYAPDCVGVLTVHLRVMPTDAAGHPLCDTTGAHTGCIVDVSDSADIRNNQ